MTIRNNGIMAEIHSSTYPEDIKGIRRISTGEEFGCVICVSADGFDIENYEEYDIPPYEEEVTEI